AEARQADAHEVARGLLGRAAEIEDGLARAGQLEEELRSARRFRVRQDAARALAAELGLAADGGELAAAVPKELTALEAEMHALEQRLHPDAEVLAARQRLETMRREH